MKKKLQKIINLIKRFKRKRPRATVFYDKKVAKSYFKDKFYTYEQDRIKNMYENYIYNLSKSSPKSPVVMEIVDKYIDLAYRNQTTIFKVLHLMSKKVIHCLTNNEPLPTHRDLMGIVYNPFMLLAAYRNIRGKEGAFKDLDIAQQEYVKKSFTLPDGINWDTIFAISNLLKSNRYPWSASRQIWIPKG